MDGYLIPSDWFFAIIGVIVGAVIAWFVFLFFTLPWKRTKQRIEAIEKDTQDLKGRIDEYRKEISLLAEQLTTSSEEARNMERRVALPADTVGVKESDLLLAGQRLFSQGNLDAAIHTLVLFYICI